MNPRLLANQYSYILVGSLALVAGAAYVSRDPTAGRWIAWLAAAALLYVLYLFLQPGEPDVEKAAALQEHLNQGVPLLLELYSNYCIGCMIVKPVVDGLEDEPGVRARIIRVEVTSPEGRKVAARFGLEMTPTFIALDSQGQEQWRLVGGATSREDLVNRLRRLG